MVRVHAQLLSGCPVSSSFFAFGIVTVVLQECPLLMYLSYILPLSYSLDSNAYARELSALISTVSVLVHVSQ